MNNQNDPAAQEAKAKLAEKRRLLLEGQSRTDAPPAPAATESAPAASAPVPVSEPAPVVAASAAEPVKKEEPTKPVASPGASEPQAGTLEWYRDFAAQAKKDKETLAGTLGAQIKTLKDDKAELERRVMQLETGGVLTQPPLPSAEPTGQAPLTAEKAREIIAAKAPSIDVSNWEDDDLILWALPFHEQELNGSSPEVGELKQTVEEMQARSTYDRFCVAVEAQAPGFMQAQGNPYDGIEGDPGWVAFLNEPVMAGAAQTRGEWMAASGTVVSMADIFKDYQNRASSAAAKPSPENNLPSIEEQAAPAPVAAVSQSSQGERFLRAEVERFFDDLKTKRKHFTPENQALWRKYKLAERENRLD